MAVVAAVVWASVSASSYRAVWAHGAAAGWLVPASALGTVGQWVNSGLMTVFFLAVGLEIGRERTSGSLSDIRNAVLPVAGAAGGMAGTALVYLATVSAAGAGPAASRGWGVPMATDVAFTLGAMALLGRRVPPALRVFVLALAVADDVGSVIVLAFVSSSGVKPEELAGAAVWFAALFALRRSSLGNRWPVWVAATAAGWLLLAWAGVEPTLAGAFAGILVPCAPHGLPSPSGLLERPLARLAALAVVPLFALANTGVSLGAAPLASGPARSVAVALVVSRLVGKVVGIAGTAALLAAARVVRLPAGVSWLQLAGATALCGMGVTVPLLFASSEFAAHASLLAAARIGLLLATVAAALVGSAVIAAAHRRSRRIGTA